MAFAPPVAMARAATQQPAMALEWLTVDLWPDYDRASILVLFTGSLTADASLPAAVTLPLPADATLNAVARISDDNQMIDDIEYERGDGALMLTTPDRRFRVEYYMPYEADGSQRAFTFNWTGGPAVRQMDVSVQQPLAATSMTVQPAPASIIDGSDGLQYHNMPMRQLQESESYTVQVSYQMAGNQLTAGSVATASAGAAGASDGDAAVDPVRIDWSIVLGVAGATLLLLAIGWQVFGARLLARRAPRKPRPLRAMRHGGVRFCHQCGTEAGPGDRFCRECGTELKKG